MKIPSKNHQFTGKPTLLLVTAAQDAVLYKAEDGEMYNIMEIIADKKEDSDKPGVSRTKRPNVVEHGIALEEKQQKLREKAIKDFLGKLEDNLKKTEELERIKSIYLFTPDFMEEGIINALPKEVKNKVEKTFLGNYTKEHPLELVKKIDSLLAEKRVIPTDEEAAKILKRGKRQ
ncbi:MAG: hypothetical protein ACQESA_01990 [Patescibacteria group bacterium]